MYFLNKITARRISWKIEETLIMNVFVGIFKVVKMWIFKELQDCSILALLKVVDYCEQLYFPIHDVNINLK
jgi:hypothetical protein